MADEAQETSLRDDIQASIGESEAPEAVETPTAPESPAEPAQEAAPETQDGRERDEHGRFAPKGKKATEAAPEAPEKPGAAAAPPPPETPAAPAEPEMKAPQSWKPLAREDWAKVPPSIRQEVVRRETETARALQESSEARRFQAQVGEALRPYEMLARAAGQHPVQYAAGLMQTAAQLQTGAPQQRAAVVASIIRQFGVDVEQLAAALDGQPAPTNGAAHGPVQDPRVDQILQRIEQAERQRTESVQARAASDAQKFAQAPGHEFYEDVREVMADVIEVAARRGVEMSLEDAYARAVQMDPDLAKIVQQREAAKARTTAATATARSRAAASSVRSSPAAGPAAQPDDLRSTILESVEEVRQR